MNALGILAVSLGAALGACLRWALGLCFNSVLVSLPLGTLIANLTGGYAIGICVGLFSTYPDLSPAWKLFLVTGFLGGLTTFSTFSAEAMSLMQKGDWAWALGHSALHLLGAILCCFAGFATWRAVFA
ncbi:MAG: fluoride efflux transporter CrcB [Undibacterium sp.]|nr:fluoride efflux transporter CrcB [Undibacterium sp.]